MSVRAIKTLHETKRTKKKLRRERSKELVKSEINPHLEIINPFDVRARNNQNPVFHESLPFKMSGFPLLRAAGFDFN